MIYFNNDYSEGCHEKVLQKLCDTNMDQTFGYGEDAYCAAAAGMIRQACGREDLAVHFLVGGTQTRLPSSWNTSNVRCKRWKPYPTRRQTLSALRNRLPTS